SDLFWNIGIKPAADLDRLEEVLVVTRMQGPQMESAEAPPVRAADVLAQRLPGVSHRESAPAIPPSSGPRATAGTLAGPGGDAQPKNKSANVMGRGGP